MRTPNNPQETIAQELFGITEQATGPEVFAQAYGATVGGPQDRDFVAFEYARLSLPSNDIDVRERRIAFDSLQALFMRGERRDADPLSDWPVYEELAQRHGKKSPGPALLIGSISPLTSKTFCTMAPRLYGATSAHIVDLRGGRTKAQYGNFVLGNAMQLPFRDGSMQHVQTNQLFHMLKNPESENTSFRHRVRQVCHEIARVLAPDGQVWMKELIPDYKTICDDNAECAARANALADTVSASFRQEGLDKFVARPIIGADDLNYMFGKSPGHSKYISYASMAIYAHKAARRTFVVGRR